MTEELYYKNIAALAGKNQKLFEKMAILKNTKKFDVILSADDPVNINIVEAKTKKKMFQNPVDETLKRLSEFEAYLRYPLLAFYGFGNGVFLKAVLQNKIHQKVIVIEPEIEILFICFHVLDFSEDILSGRLNIYLEEDADYPTIRWFIASSKLSQFLKTYDMQITAPYYASRQQEILYINKIFIEAILHYIRSHGNDAEDSLVGIDHFWKNMPRMLSNPPFKQLLTKRNSDVAIIVSTGPSLTKQLPLLKEIKDFVTIISVDASLPILEKWDIKPDLVTSMERVEATAKFFKNTSKKFQKDITIVSSALQHKEIYKNIKDGQLVVPMRPFGYMQILGIDEFGYIGIGLSAANMAFELAFLMDFDAVIFIGQDLAYGDDGKSHAKEHIFGENEVSLKDEDIYMPAYGGKGLARTNEIWKLFHGFFVTAISDAKDYIIAYNCTEGGIRIDGTVEMPFCEAVDKLVKKDKKKGKILLEKPSSQEYEKYIAHAKKNMTAMLKYAKAAKKSVEKLFLDVAYTCEELEKQNKQNELEKIDFKKIKRLLSRIDRLKETSATETFRQLFWDTVQSYILSQELDLAVVAVKPFRTDMEQKARMIEFLFGHKPWLFMLAGGMDAVISAIERNKEMIFKEAAEAKKRTKKAKEA